MTATFNYLIRQGNFNWARPQDKSTNIHMNVVVDGNKTYINLHLAVEEYDHYTDMFRDDPLDAVPELLKEMDGRLLSTRDRDDIIAFKKAFRNNYADIERNIVTAKISKLEKRLADVTTKLERAKKHLAYILADELREEDLPFPEVAEKRGEP